MELSNEYNTLHDQFENSELSNMMSWDEFSSTKSGYYGDAWQASYNDRTAQSDYNAKKRMNL